MKNLRRHVRFIYLILCLSAVLLLCSCGKTAPDPVVANPPEAEAPSGQSKSGDTPSDAQAPAASDDVLQTAEADTNPSGTAETTVTTETNVNNTEELAAGANESSVSEPAASDHPSVGTGTPEHTATPDESDTASGTGMTAEQLIEKINGPEEIGVFDDVEYVKKKNVESYLILGIDRGGEYSTSDYYFGGGQSDLLMLLVLDKDAKTFTPVQINRDTMAVIDVLDVFGNPIDQTTAHITLAYAMGDGTETSAQNACRAVSNLFGGIDIDGYASITYGAVPGINDAVGGVTVEIEDDFTAQDPSMYKGATVTLKGEQATLFCRARMNVGDGMNTSRMRRQSVYMNAFLKQCRQAAKGRSAVINDVYNAAKPFMMTNMDWNTMSNVGTMILSYSNMGIKSPTGTVNSVRYADGNKYSEFTADSGNIAEMIRDLYYTPAN